MGNIIQAQKAWILRDIIESIGLLRILIAGNPNDSPVHIGIGKSIQGIAVVAVEVLLIRTLSRMHFRKRYGQFTSRTELQRKFSK